MSRIVVGVDGSAESKAGLLWAVHHAEASGSSVTAVLAWSFLDQGQRDDSEPFDATYGADDALESLESIITTTVGTTRAVDIERKVVCDLPVRALLEASEGAALLVLGARGLGGFKALLLGSVSQQCLLHATCPVVIVRGEVDRLPERITRIVVGVDGSEPAQRALEWALEAGRQHGSSIEAVNVWTFPYMTGEVFTAVPYDSTPLAAAASRILDEALRSADTTGLPAPVVRTVASGGAATTLLQIAEAADLVVVGSRGRGGFTQLLLGSVSQQVAHHGTCPVVIMRPTEQASS